MPKSNIGTNVTFTEEFFFYDTRREIKISTGKPNHAQIGQFMDSDQY